MVFSKKSLFLFILFSLTVSVLFGQSASGNTQNNGVTLSENEITLDLGDLSADSDGSFSQRGKSSSSVWPFIKMILVLLLVCAAIYGILFYVKKRGKGTRSDDQFLRRVAYLNLAPGKSVEVVTLVDKGAYLLGVSDAGINLIAEVKDEELIQAMNLYSDKQKNVSKPKNFADVLDMFMPGGPRDNGSSRTNGNAFSSLNTQGNMFQTSENRNPEQE